MPFEGKLFHFIYGNDLTRNLQSLGIEQIDQTVGKYRVIANASLHRASIAKEKEVWEIDRQIGTIYDGGIQIYGQIDFRVEEKPREDTGLLIAESIWTGITDEEQNPQPNLKELIFGKDPTPQRIEAILEGYQIQNKETARAETSKQHESFLSGQRSRR